MPIRKNAQRRKLSKKRMLHKAKNMQLAQMQKIFFQKAD